MAIRVHTRRERCRGKGNKADDALAARALEDNARGSLSRGTGTNRNKADGCSTVTGGSNKKLENSSNADGRKVERENEKEGSLALGVSTRMQGGERGSGRAGCLAARVGAARRERMH
ncbi:uncharacterized protein SPSK_08087 [Sporothrix schenckii 1099-18]|uniref:Uncharacterized protein n=1 Tax=Sporothrix schenckii 1099-18 TaxID=1397361 RepID=A0A0F2MGQ6_SPOSC|nr:uncharacterized protein SPSK_08087 [Sporothrix schenckii 1099-18]KJR88817.1 hypothetical protein SPSK_08087 [Sporothrix schenckii 1099-18]